MLMQCCGHNGCRNSKVAETNLLEGQNFEVIEQSGQNQGRVHFPIDFFREVLITKGVFQSSERCCSLFDALADYGVRGERANDD
jgi:hypothetical protein